MKFTTYAHGRVTTRSRAAHSEDDSGVIVLPLIADQGDKPEPNELRGHLRSLFTSDDRGEVAEPLQGGDGRKAVLVKLLTLS